MYKLVFALILVGCSKTLPVTCSTNLVQKRDLLGNIDMTTRCDCSCPEKNNTNLIESAGIFGGLLNLATDGN